VTRGASIEDGTVVIVDTWPMVRLGVARVCQSAGMRVIDHTGDPVEGLAVARARHADVVVLGRHAGIHAEIIRQAKAVPGDPAVVVMTRLAGRNELVSLLTAGADALVPRSVGPDEFLQSLAKVFAG
jgi:DNA-binding NarL/FixJ family response regulator